MRVQVVPPDCANTCAGLLVVFRLGQIHQVFGGVLHQLGVVGDRPDQGDARPQFRRDQRSRIVVGGVRRRIILEQVHQRLHQRAVGMIDNVGDQLAGGGLGLDAGDQLAAGRAHHLDLDLGKALVELLDDVLLDLGEVRRVEHELAFVLGRSDQLGRTEIIGGSCRRALRAPNARPAAAVSAMIFPDINDPPVPFCFIPLRRRRLAPPGATASWRRRSARRAAPSAPG